MTKSVFASFEMDIPGHACLLQGTLAVQLWQSQKQLLFYIVVVLSKVFKQSDSGGIQALLVLYNAKLQQFGEISAWHFRPGNDTDWRGASLDYSCFHAIQGRFNLKPHAPFQLEKCHLETTTGASCFG